MYSCGWKSLSAYNPAPKEIWKDCHRQSSWKGFRFLLEDTRVAQMLPLTGAWIQACHLKRTIYKFNSVNMQCPDLVKSKLWLQMHLPSKDTRGQFTYLHVTWTQKHAAPPCSPTPYCLFSLSCISLSFLLLGSLIRSINRFVFQQMGL